MAIVTDIFFGEVPRCDIVVALTQQTLQRAKTKAFIKQAVAIDEPPAAVLEPGMSVRNKVENGETLLGHNEGRKDQF